MLGYVPWSGRCEIVYSARERGAAVIAGSVDGLVQACWACNVDVATWICCSLPFVELKVLSLRISWDGDSACWGVCELLENLFESALLVGLVESIHDILRHGQGTVVLADVGRCNDVGHGCVVSKGTVTDCESFQRDVEVSIDEDLVCKVRYL